MSLVIGGLYSFFAAAPGVLMTELGLTDFQLGLSFAATVLIVFVAGFLRTTPGPIAGASAQSA